MPSLNGKSWMIREVYQIERSRVSSAKLWRMFRHYYRCFTNLCSEVKKMSEKPELYTLEILADYQTLSEIIEFMKSMVTTHDIKIKLLKPYTPEKGGNKNEKTE